MPNSGQVFWVYLEQYYVDNGEPTGLIKPNLPNDPDYVPISYNDYICPKDPSKNYAQVLAHQRGRFYPVIEFTNIPVNLQVIDTLNACVAIKYKYSSVLPLDWGTVPILDFIGLQNTLNTNGAGFVMIMGELDTWNSECTYIIQYETNTTSSSWSYSFSPISNDTVIGFNGKITGTIVTTHTCYFKIRTNKTTEWNSIPAQIFDTATFFPATLTGNYEVQIYTINRNNNIELTYTYV